LSQPGSEKDNIYMLARNVCFFIFIQVAAASDKVNQLLAHGRWFSPGTPASFTTKSGRHDIAEILLKVVVKHQKSKSNQIFKRQYLYVS
jgi:hypothetical protein